NGSSSNDYKHPVAPDAFRGFMGGDVNGITAKIQEGYFNKLGVDAIWMTPLVENIISHVDEGTGVSYGFHGYWTKDWTAFDKRIGTKKEIAQMVKVAHDHGIRVIFDVVINHTGPVTPLDVQWPEEWVRTDPGCTYQDYGSTVTCTLVKNLPDIKTESTAEVKLPDFLIKKWKTEGRYEEEMTELDAFFARTNYPRRPYYYIIKWLTDLIRDFGIDGFRVDTAKHTEEEIWKVLRDEAVLAREDWKKTHSTEVMDDSKFYMVGEVYNYYAGNGRIYDFGDKKVDYFNYGFDALINFDFKGDAQKSYQSLFSKYDALLRGPLKGKSVLNYISSHDDGNPFDKSRAKPFESATKLLLTQGAAQIYYGDESARSLKVKAKGDATLRSFMNWEEQKSGENAKILEHWQKLGQFRRNHLSVGAGKHFLISEKPLVFGRIYEDKLIRDMIVCALEMNTGIKKIPVQTFFYEGEVVVDFYSGTTGKVLNGMVEINSPFDLVLLQKTE
ncbi:MAG: alpha-amylase, partial [Saprospiraceae bacterium]|nr:alpha-amylase [Saprospiraceae bacterium]